LRQVDTFCLIGECQVSVGSFDGGEIILRQRLKTPPPTMELTRDEPSFSTPAQRARAHLAAAPLALGAEHALPEEPPGTGQVASHRAADSQVTVRRPLGTRPRADSFAGARMS